MTGERCGYILETMTLNNLFKILSLPCHDKRNVLGISDDSRIIQKDWLFLCRKGAQENGLHYVEDVLAKGGVVLWEEEAQNDCYHVDSMDVALPLLLNSYYQTPCEKLCVIGVTGTNGKTSVTMILDQLLHMLQQPTMVIGTNHIRYLDQNIHIDNTTPSACTLAYYFNKAVQEHIKYVLMEVSSHAIDQKRISFLQFDYVLYTNIAKDHLDYHITRTHYMYTKFKLRKYLKQHGVIIINHDMEELHPLYQLSDDKIITFGKQQAHFQITDVTYSARGIFFALEGTNYEIPLLGEMNVYNAAEALVVLHHLKFLAISCQKAASLLQCVPGRMEIIEHKDSIVWLDYAHTESALEEVCQLAHLVKQTKLICVVGCGGDRDKEKRPNMARIALRYSDFVIFTADNPRSEEIHAILFDMIRDLVGNYEIRENRACAIKSAMTIAQSHDIIVIAGKGDETTQSINGKKYPLQDRELVERYSKMEEQDL